MGLATFLCGEKIGVRLENGNLKDEIATPAGLAMTPIIEWGQPLNRDGFNKFGTSVLSISVKRQSAAKLRIDA